MTLKDFGNTGGASIPLTLTLGKLKQPVDRSLKVMLLGYGVGLSWGAALIHLEPNVIMTHVEYTNERNEKNGS